LRRLAPAHDLDLHVAHLNHGIRTEADDDADFVQDLAADWGLPCTTETVDLPRLADQKKLSLEEAARRVRYAFLCRVAQNVGGHHIAVGHNADDQAETVLMHLLRGAGPAGLRGMLPSTRLREDCQIASPRTGPAHVTVIRPLLGTPRASIEAYCAAHELETRFDRSNLDTTYFRNKLRHDVLPYLDEVNPGISERLRHLAEIVRADYRLLQEFVRVAWDTLLVGRHPDALVFDLNHWREQPLAIQRAIIRRAAYRLRKNLRDVDFNHVEAAVDIAQRGETGAQATLPHQLRLTVGYETLTIAEAGALHLPEERPWLKAGEMLPVVLPGETTLPGGWSLHAQEASHWNLEAIVENPNPLVAWIDKAALTDKPILRTRQEGDRFRPQGMQGSEVRLSDFLINTKVPRQRRDHLPLLVAGDEILWITGMRLSEVALVRPETEAVVYLRFHSP
jgi:tRNA(Ile)-lysidine synthase